MLKTVSQLQEGDVVHNCVYMLRDIDIRKSKVGSRYIKFKLADVTGVISGILWENVDLGVTFPDDLKYHFRIDEALKVQGIVKSMPKNKGGYLYIQLSFIQTIDHEPEMEF